MGKVYRGASEEEHSAGERKAIWVEQPNGERFPQPDSGSAASIILFANTLMKLIDSRSKP